jgi:hypothetical protein
MVPPVYLPQLHVHCQLFLLDHPHHHDNHSQTRHTDAGGPGGVDLTHEAQSNHLPQPQDEQGTIVDTPQNHKKESTALLMFVLADGITLMTILTENASIFSTIATMWGATTGERTEHMRSVQAILH